MSWKRRAVRSAAAAVAVAVLGSCSSETTNTPVDPGNPATISISISPNSGSIEQGGSTTITGTATIGGNFTGTVTFSITGLPAGVTGSVGTVSVSGTTATAPITVDVGPSVAPGTYSGTITATGSGVSANASYSLTVTAAPGFSLGTVGNLSLQQGASDTRTVDIVRSGGFSADVTIAVEGAPSGLTATPNPATTAGNSSTITVDASGAPAIGTYTLTVRGTATGEPDATTTFDVTVTAPPAGTMITVDFSVCPTDERPVWASFMDGMGGSWTQVTGVNDVYTFTATQSELGFAVVLDSGSGVDLSVDYFTPAEALLAAAEPCGNTSTRAITGTLAGSVGFSNNVTFGGASQLVFMDGTFGINGIPDGAQDLVVYSTNSGAGSDRMYVLRDQNPANGADIGTVDLTADGFDPASATITVSGLVGGENGFVGMDYATSSAGSVCAVAPLQSGLLSGSSYMGFSAPPAEQAAGEFHVAAVNVSGGSLVKTLKESFATLADRTVTLPADLPTPTLTDVTGSASYLRLQADFAVPSEFNFASFFDYSVSNYNMTVFKTASVQSGSVSLAMPDFSAVSGWDNAWGIPSASTGVGYVISAVGGSVSSAALCTDGGRSTTSTRAGSYN